MKAVIQRVSSASVAVNGVTAGKIERGFLVLLGVATGDTREQADYLARKIAELRVFPDEEGKMNRSITDIAGGILIISNFTLCADCRKGRRPSFVGAARPEEAEKLYEYFAALLESRSIPIQRGIFGAEMKVSLLNDGPVTILMDTKEMLGDPIGK